VHRCVRIVGGHQIHGLRLISRAPIARQPRDHVLFQGTFSRTELAALRNAIDRALEA